MSFSHRYQPPVISALCGQRNTQQIISWSLISQQPFHIISSSCCKLICALYTRVSLKGGLTSLSKQQQQAEGASGRLVYQKRTEWRGLDSWETMKTV
jgi:hypothetical protein